MLPVQPVYGCRIRSTIMKQSSHQCEGVLKVIVIVDAVCLTVVRRSFSVMKSMKVDYMIVNELASKILYTALM